MRFYFTFLTILLFSLPAASQTFTGTGGTIPGISTTRTCFSINVSGVGNINNTYGLASLCLNITHSYDDELEIVLKAPDGTTIPISIQNGGSGNNYTNTCFTATASTPIKFGTAPFTGSFLPEGYLGAANNGQNANGTWQLCIQDRRGSGNAGSLLNWSISFNNTPAPAPPAMPACANNLPSTSSCSTATLICDFNGQCGSTAGTTTQTWPGLSSAACFGLQNNSFIKFIASATTASFSVWVPTTENTYNLGGIQMLFFSGPCNASTVNTFGCYPHILAYETPGQPIISIVSASGLTPGNTYYLMIDGFNSDHCTFTIAANTGVNILNVSPADPMICAGSSVNLTASGGNGVYSWSPAGFLSATSGTTVTANPPSTTTYTVSSTTATGCPLTKDVTVTINPLPAAATITSVQPNCSNATGSITITSPIGAGLQYSIDGITFQAGTVFNNVAPGNYNVIVENQATGCKSVATSVTINTAPVVPAVATVSVSAQPTCTTPTGTITITAPIGANLQYSINGGTTYQTSPSFTGIAPGNYNVTVQNTSSNCISNASTITVNPVPAPPVAPTASVTTQPTCTIPAGTVTILAPLGAGLQYSADGINYQPGSVFTSLSPGTYNIYVQNTTTGCISPATPVIVNTIPAPPAIPTASVTVQPTCTSPTGTIVFTAPAGANLQYSINGTTYQTGTIFNNVTPGNYNLTVQNMVTGCISAPMALIVNAAPITPAAPTVSVTTQPTCITNTGTITVTAPTGANLQYSINGTTFQSSTVFNGIVPGNYAVTVQQLPSGCISSATAVTVNAIPTAPAAAQFTITQPTCISATGTVLITSPVGSNLEYSIDGMNYQASTGFSSLAPGNYNVTVQNIVTGCTSPIAVATINAAPVAPATPVLSISTAPACTSPVGSITVTAPLGVDLQYALNGGAYQSSPVFNNLPAGNYSITVQHITSLCISAPGSIIMPVATGAPQIPEFNIIHANCTNTTGSISITSPLGANLEYSLNGGPYQTATAFTNLLPGGYTVTARYIGTSCISSHPIAFLKAANPADCAGPDIYFPTIFTPNGDGKNDAFGPGPQFNLALVKGYILQVYNRYGEKVFETRDPYEQWNGKYHGKLSANYNYTWIASYSYAGKQMLKKGNVLILK